MTMDYTVAAVDEAIKLLFLVAQQPGLGLTELSRRSANTKARTFRLLSTLEQQDLVKRHGDPATYCLSFRALHLGTAARSQIDLVQCVEDSLARLVALFNETVAVRVREGLETVCVARGESTRSLRVVHGELGHRRTLYAGASSKLLLAFAPAEVIDAVMAGHRERFTAATPAAKSALLKEIRAIRESGHAVSIGERTADTAAVAVPIRGAQSDVVAALSISTPASRMTDERVQQYLAALKAEARESSKRLGCSDTTGEC
jgi:IclR family KDG regulon transcriptional repressor